jgi:hypothetical protein
MPDTIRLMPDSDGTRVAYCMQRIAFGVEKTPDL